ncbi:MAG: transglycosylase SLT domain-containing protein [Colwellia sp.]|nr:transglycosylase SLT domain-containing protein [Colwellia sp.]
MKFLIIFWTLSFIAYGDAGDKQRKLYLSADKQVWKSDSNQYKRLYQQLNDYPLQPYLDQKRLMHNITLAKSSEILKFLDKYQGSPLERPLRKKWLKYLAKRNRQTLFIESYKPVANVAMTCYYYRYKLNKGALEKDILPKVTSLWLVGKSQPKVCDPLFKKWQQAGYRTESIIWRRIKLAAIGGKHTLIPYLTKLLPKSQQYLASLWHKVRRDPAYITRLKRFRNKSAAEAEIFSYGIKRLIWRNPKSALKVYDKAVSVFTFTEQQQQLITQKFALALASKHHKDAQKWLHKVEARLLDDGLIQWRIADALRSQDWSAIIAELDSLPKANQSKLLWRYWYGRSLIETGNKEAGQSLLTEVATQRHYYGFLASSYLGIPFNLQDQPLEFTKQEKTQVFSHAAAKRAFEFFYLGRYTQARKEWNYWLTHLNDKQKLIAAKVANEAQWYDRAIFTLSKVGYLNDVNLRFPLAFDDEIIRHSDKNKINPAWAFAIARRESSFMPDAHSAVGAKGLMQIMPGTAKHLIRRSVSKKYLLNARNNIKLGTKYLRKLLDRNNGNRVLATASYNAGPYRVKSWLKNIPSIPADMWIETIPYKETRDYVKSVLAYQQIYQVRVGQSGSLFDELVTMDIVN